MHATGNGECPLSWLNSLTIALLHYRLQEKCCSMEELQSMFVELAQGFESSTQWFSSPSMVSNQGCSSNLHQQSTPISQSSTTPTSNFGVF